MEQSEEKFFEELARGSKRREPEEPEAELAKASVAPTARTKPARKINDDFSGEPEGQLTIDVYQTSDDIVIESAIAGVKPEDLDIDVNTDSVTIRGERHRDEKIKDEDYFYQECYWGRFSRSVILPQEIDPEKANVSFKNGILTVRLPKLSRSRSRKLKVKVE